MHINICIYIDTHIYIYGLHIPACAEVVVLLHLRTFCNVYVCIVALTDLGLQVFVLFVIVYY